MTNVGAFVAQVLSPGFSVSSTASPKATTLTTIGTASVQLVAANAARRHIEFFSPVATGSTVFVMPGTTAVINQGIPVGGGSSYIPPTFLNVTVAWNAISSVVAATSVLTVVEFF